MKHLLTRAIRLSAKVGRKAAFIAGETVIGVRNKTGDAADLLRYMTGTRGTIAKARFVLNKEAKEIGRATGKAARKLRYQTAETAIAFSQEVDDAINVLIGSKTYSLPKRYSSVTQLLSPASVIRKETAEGLISRLSARCSSVDARSLIARADLDLIGECLVDSIGIDELKSGVTRLLGNTPSIYDVAADAEYLRSHIGGGQLHRLLDGNHTLAGMWDAVKDASPDDSLLQEVHGYATALLKDLCTSRGLPIVTLTKDQYESFADELSDSLGFSREWTQSLLHVNGQELIGIVTNTLSVMLNWDKEVSRRFAELAMRLGVTSIFGDGHPVLIIMSLAAAAKGFQVANQREEVTEYCVALTKQGLMSGICLLPLSVVPGGIVVHVIMTLCASAVAKQVLGRIDERQVALLLNDSIQKLRQSAGTGFLTSRTA